jgi:hypothetical protein
VQLRTYKKQPIFIDAKAKPKRLKKFQKRGKSCSNAVRFFVAMFFSNVLYRSPWDEQTGKIFILASHSTEIELYCNSLLEVPFD